MAAHPVAFVAFDCLAHEDQGLLDEPLRTRRATLETLALPPGQPLAPVWTAASAEELDALFGAAQARGNEGLMAKQPEAPYASGRRGAQWLKVKRPLDTLDVVVVGAEWGHGKRRAVLSDLTFAVRDEDTGRLVTIGKAYNGLTDVEIRAMTERLLALTVEDHGHYRTVRPEIVLEVAFNHLQRSLAAHLRLRAPLPAHRASPPGSPARDREHARGRGAAGNGGGGGGGAERDAGEPT